MKLLVAGILALVALGLYRRYTEDRASNEDTVRDDASLVTQDQNKGKNANAKLPTVESIEATPVGPREASPADP